MREREQAKPEGSKLGDAFDAVVRGLEGQQDALKTKPTTLREVHSFLGIAQTFIVQTYRTESGDTALVEYVGADGTVRLALPPSVTETLARQRETLTSKSRKRGAAQAVRTREELGIKPGFLKGKG